MALSDLAVWQAKTTGKLPFKRQDLLVAGHADTNERPLAVNVQLPMPSEQQIGTDAQVLSYLADVVVTCLKYKALRSL
ncbi:hypothetical protein RF55_19060 [Lasius niger]|uniref:Uncharacterized protein n=1 Tax=Lasius niger TaxID=67767 RepID=A0A0J7MTH5_LASNI|nr:hypothetical protein RF55_19060 [Lasius niger]